MLVMEDLNIHRYKHLVNPSTDLRDYKHISLEELNMNIRKLCIKGLFIVIMLCTTA